MNQLKIPVKESTPRTLYRYSNSTGLMVEWYMSLNSLRITCFSAFLSGKTSSQHVTVKLHQSPDIKIYYFYCTALELAACLRPTLNDYVELEA